MTRWLGQLGRPAHFNGGENDMEYLLLGASILFLGGVMLYWKVIAAQRLTQLNALRGAYADLESEHDQCGTIIKNIQRLTEWTGDILKPHHARIIVAKIHQAAGGAHIDWDALRPAEDNTRRDGYVPVTYEREMERMSHEAAASVKLASELCVGLELANIELERAGLVDKVVRELPSGKPLPRADLVPREADGKLVPRTAEEFAKEIEKVRRKQRAVQEHMPVCPHRHKRDGVCLNCGQML